MSHNFGNTTNFQVNSTDSFWAGLSSTQQTNVTANANFLLGQVEAAFTTTTGWFATDTSKFGTSHQQQVVFDQPDGKGAFNNGYGSAIHVDTQSNNATIGTAGPIVCMLWMAEWAEILMSLTSGWNAGDSSGEGLSHYCALQLFLNGHNDYYNAGGNQIFVQNWLNGDGTTNPNTATPNAARSDWVNNTFKGAKVGGVQVNGDGDPVSYGCALCFIYYLTVQLGFTINEVIANYSANLASCYHAVTGDASDPFPGFLGILEHIFPAGQTATLTGTNPDNPFPIAEVTFYSQKNTFGKDETQDIINHQGGLISAAFWVVIDGVSQQAFENLAVQVAPFTGAFANLQGNGVQITANPAGPEFQNGVSAKSPQRIRIPFDITLSSAIMSQFPATGVSPELDLSTSLTVGGVTVSGSNATMDFELIAAGDPYFTDIDPQQNNQPYLSQDLRVFGAVPMNNTVPFPGGPTFSDDSVNGAYTYIQALLTYLNNTPGFTNPFGTDPFSLLPDQQGEGQTDSSVAPFALSSGFLPLFVNRYSFAIARVRLRGSSGASGAASNVRVFFRVFASQSPDTDYDPNGTYASQPDAANEPGSPLPGGGETTIPFFATGNSGVQTDYQPGGPNIQTLTIPAGQNDLWSYYGCFLNFYDPNNQVAGQQVQAWLPGTHHCVVAQIAYDDAPIPSGVSPMSWDQLAQRNLQFTVVDNPGPAATHRAPQTFDIRPSKAIGQPGGAGLPPDELMIDWGTVPDGATASIYWPAVSAADVIALAGIWGGAAGLSSSDAHTLTLKIEGGVSYVPIPTGTGQNFAGLITVELQPGIRRGQEFEVVVRRIGTRLGKPAPPPAPVLQSAPSRKILKVGEPAAPAGRVAEVVIERLIQWRYVVGTFVVRIPVSTGEKMLVPEAMTLAIMKWRLAHLSPGSRWAPVLERYIKYCAGRLDGVGGDSSQVPPSLTWTPPLTGDGGKGHGPHPGEAHGELCGKVIEVLFDCHGELEGFELDECCGQRVLVESRARGVADLVLRACRENLTVCVKLCPKTRRIESVAIRA
ncbi:MAG: hypothetical protein WAN72_15270 [Candidatus Acidiferrales bacterium]